MKQFNLHFKYWSASKQVSNQLANVAIDWLFPGNGKAEKNIHVLRVA